MTDLLVFAGHLSQMTLPNFNFYACLCQRIFVHDESTTGFVELLLSWTFFSFLFLVADLDTSQSFGSYYNSLMELHVGTIL